MMANILLVEDHPLFADAMQLCVTTQLEAAEVARAATLTEAKALLRHGPFDLIILDLWLPDAHGFEGLLDLRSEFPSLPVLVNSAFADPEIVHRAMVYGAAGFLPKSASSETVAATIRTVLAGNLSLPATYRPPPILGATNATSFTTKLHPLTNQQVRVLQMLCQGLLNKQIAHLLDIGETTVKAHVSEILRKLSVSSRTQAVLEVSRLNLGALLALYASDEPLGPAARNRCNRALEQH